MALNIAIALISALAVHEIILALGLSKNYILLGPSLVFSAAFPFAQEIFFQDLSYFLYTVVMFAALIRYHKSITFREVGVIYSMSLLIPTALTTIVELRSLGEYHGMFYVIIAIFSAWIADTGAFAAGSLWGKHKLCPAISPKKTVEGVVGAFVLNTAAMLVFGLIFDNLFNISHLEISYLALALVGIGSAVMSILGDLSFSLIKRSCHIKDFGQVIPGHGGILDRFDSVIFTAPFVYLLFQVLPLLG